MTESPDLLVAELLHPDGTAVEFLELGFEFLERSGIPTTKWERPVRVEIEGQLSKAGNTFFDFSLNGIPLPNGTETGVRIGDAVVEFGELRESQKGNPTREGRVVFDYRGTLYEATVYVTKTAKSYFMKFHAQKSSGGAKRGSGRLA